MTDSNDPHPLAERIATSVREQIEKNTGSRRKFLNRSALAGGTLLALGGGTGFAMAQEGEDDDEEADEMTATFDDIEGTDIDVLNYALTLEHLENTFYREALEMFDEIDFVEADALQSFDEGTRQAVFGYVGTVADHEAVHVDVLTQAVELLGGDPAEEAMYDFGVESVADFLVLGQVLENTGVAAYAGAGPYIESPDLQSAALSIHSVEARHAAILNWVNGESPFPNAFDPASSQQEVLDAVTPFFATENGGGGNGTETPTPNGTENGGGGNGTEIPTPNGTENGGGGNGTDIPTPNGTESGGGGNGTVTPAPGNEST